MESDRRSAEAACPRQRMCNIPDYRPLLCDLYLNNKKKLLSRCRKKMTQDFDISEYVPPSVLTTGVEGTATGWSGEFGPAGHGHYNYQQMQWTNKNTGQSGSGYTVAFSCNKGTGRSVATALPRLMPNASRNRQLAIEYPREGSTHGNHEHRRTHRRHRHHSRRQHEGS